LALDGATPFRLATSSAQRERIMGAVDKPQRWGQLTPRNTVAAIPVGALWKCGNQGTPTRARAGNAGGIGGSGAGRGTAPARGDWRGPSAVQLRGVELNPCPDASGRANCSCYGAAMRPLEGPISRAGCGEPYGSL